MEDNDTPNDEQPQAALTANKIVELLGAAAFQDAEQAEAVRSQMLLHVGMTTLNMDVSDLLPVVNSNLGYLCGYLPAEYANRLLTWLDIEHPVFGKQINEYADAAFQAGRRIAEHYEARKRNQEASARKRAKAAEGLNIPDPDATVSSEQAAELLEAIRAKREAMVP